MEERRCIICGNINLSRSKQFCSEKCHQKYYYEQNKEKLIKKHLEWNQENKNKVKISNKKYYENNKEYFKKYYLEHKEDNNIINEK